MDSMMARHRQVLFVSAAPNAAARVTSTTCAPCGNPRSNNITVTSWTHDDPDQRVSAAGYGPGVDMAAPGDGLVVPTIEGFGWADGTSLAAPFVASAAALLKSAAAGALSPVEIKSMLTEHTSVQLTEPGGGVRVNFAYPLVDLLWQDHREATWAGYVLDINFDDLRDDPEIVVSTLCDEANLEISGYGTFNLQQDHPCSIGDGMYMSPDGSDFSLFMGGLNTMFDVGTFSMQNRATPFQLGYEYFLSEDDLGEGLLGFDVSSLSKGEGDRCVSEDAVDGDFGYIGFCDFGGLSFTRCTVTERTPDGSAKYLSVDIAVDCETAGVLTTLYPSDPLIGFTVEDELGTMRAYLRNVRVQSLRPFDTYTEEVEMICEGEADEEEEPGADEEEAEE